MAGHEIGEPGKEEILRGLSAAPAIAAGATRLARGSLTLYWVLAARPAQRAMADLTGAANYRLATLRELSGDARLHSRPRTR